ncbi:MAG: sulfite exporter TauE/SafE family protein [Xanthobacteraceae bacterium]|nr:sulfite exporter TauE/SafE family protein [Xanthobacteraceae bacterium]
MNPISLANSPSIWVAIGILAFLAGLLRGFAGFGSSLLLVPPLGIVLGPTVAVTVGTLLECLATLLLFFPAIQHTDRRALASLAVPASAAVPIGHAALILMNPYLSNLLISIIILGLSVWVVSGSALRFPRGLLGRLFAGALSGLFNGFGSAGGPPLMLYILSGPESAEVKRANIITVSGVALIAAVTSMYFFGFLRREALTSGMLLAPIFFVGGLIGMYLFKAAPERYYQRIALSALVVTSTIMVVVNLIHITT